MRASEEGRRMLGASSMVTAALQDGTGGPSDAVPVVDVHCHLMAPAATALIETHYSPDTILANEPYDLYAGEPSRAHNRSLAPSLVPKLRDTAPRIADMDAMGVDIQVLAPFVSQNYYWTEADLGLQLARLQNERLAEAVDQHPDRFAAIGTVPLQHTASAVAELERVVGNLGFKGVQISSNVDGVDLDDPRFVPFWQRAQELGAVVLIHPSGFTEGRRLDDWFLTNIIGNPMDSTIALTRLIFSGRLAEFGQLKLVVVHGGGYLPSYWARMDHAWENRPEARANLDERPSTYLRRVYFDTMLFAPELIANLVGFAGAAHVLLGTDYPFDMGETDPLGLLGAVPGLSDADRAAVRGGTAATLFGLS
jgi:aminocarboxymuconate-semialdehyde decarboxylase